MDQQSATDVLVIGAGPTGLTLAVDLARRGVRHRIIDQAEAYGTASRAKTIQPQSLEVMDDLGAVAAITANRRADLPTRYYGDDGAVTDKPGIAASASASLATAYPDPVWIAEFDVEAALRDRLADWGGRVELGTTATDLTQDDDGVTVAVRTIQGTSAIRARYVIAADGGKSRTRQLIGTPLVGETYEDQRFYLGDIHLNGLDRAWVHIWASAEGMLALTPLPSIDIWQLQATIAAEVEDPEPASLALYQAMLARRPGAENVTITDVTWLSVYRANVRLADHYRSNRVFLAGDAAHVHSPGGGQDMNTGIQDADNLSCKLAADLDGADDKLLDSYDEERRPVARSVLKDSTRKFDSLLKTTGDRRALATEIGSLSDDLTSGLLIRYPESTLSQQAGATPGAGPRPDVHVHEIASGGAFGNGVADRDRHARAAYDPQGDELILIRPDGYVGARAASRDTTVISDYLARHLRHPGRATET